MSRLRLTGGRLGGRWIAVPAGARPTEGRVREALFSRWQPRLEGARFLDLFAGSGAGALEAASRGAGEVVAVEGDRRARGILERNLALCAELSPPVSHRLVGLSLPAGIGRLAGGAPFDLVFADPPYAFEAYEPLLRGVAPLLAAEGELALEHSARRPAPSGGPLALVETRRYGETAVSWFRHRAG